MDYNPNAEITKTFFAAVQNKLHYAIHGNTAAEIIRHRADSTKEHMGLMTWKNAPHSKILKSDATIAKNYLTEKEIKVLDRIVTMYPVVLLLFLLVSSFLLAIFRSGSVLSLLGV